MKPKRIFQVRALAHRGRVIALIAVLLTGCATQLPLTGETLQILDLHCNADKSVVATALMRAPGATLKTEGALLDSLDGGLTWSVATRGGNLKDVAPRFFNDPRSTSAANLPLFVTGYESSGFQWNYQLSGWMKSTDSGRTWVAIPSRLPAVSSADPLGWPPSLVVVDGTGRLATIGESTTLLISDDQGASWTATQLPGFDFFTKLYDVRSDRRGRLVVVGGTTSPSKNFGANRTVVVLSEDSGKTWSVAMDQPSSASCRPRIIGTPDGPMLINIRCHGGDRHYFFSTDRGRTWQERRFFRYSHGPFELVRALDDKNWIAISIDGRSLVAWISDNGGEEWRSYATGFAILSGNPHLDEQSMVTLPGGVVLAYVSDGQLLRSGDRGKSWRIIDTGLPRSGTYSLGASCSDQQGMIILGGEQGVLIRSLDAGLTWERGRLP